MLYLILAYLMLFAALFNAICSHNVFLPLPFVFELCPWLFTHSFFIIALHHAQHFSSVGFPNLMFTSFFY